MMGAVERHEPYALPLADDAQEAHGNHHGSIEEEDHLRDDNDNGGGGRHHQAQRGGDPSSIVIASEIPLVGVVEKDSLVGELPLLEEEENLPKESAAQENLQDAEETTPTPEECGDVDVDVDVVMPTTIVLAHQKKHQQQSDEEDNHHGGDADGRGGGGEKTSRHHDDDELHNPAKRIQLGGGLAALAVLDAMQQQNKKRMQQEQIQHKVENIYHMIYDKVALTTATTTTTTVPLKMLPLNNTNTNTNTVLPPTTTSPPAAAHPSLPPGVLESGEVAAACPNLQHSKLDLLQQLGRDIDTSNVQLADCKVHRHVLWTDEEDSKLRELVQTHGAKDWRGISLKMGVERDGKSCRQRWLNHLATGVNREPFSRDEDAKIIALQREFGNKWSKIAHALGSNRSDNAVKNRWNIALKPAKQQKLAEDGRLENSAGLAAVAVTAAPAASPSSWTPLTGVKRRQPEDDNSNVADGQPAHYANQLMFVPFAWPVPSLPFMNTPTTGGVFTHGDRSVFNNEVATPHLGHGDAPPAYQGNAFQHYHNHHQHVTPLVVAAIPPPATPTADKQTPHASAAKKE
ncbi:transcription factor [Pseudoscourfieldia marina]